MSNDSMIDAVLGAQRAWATRAGLRTDSLGYLADYGANLRAPLSSAATLAFTRGSGAELLDQRDRPAKMRALRSSSALAVNVFDFWADRDRARVLAALGADGHPVTLTFEEQLPTGARGTPPNLDVVFRLDDGRLVGVESKFTEWMSPKRGMAASLAPYVDDAGSRWSRVGMGGAHALVRGIVEGGVSFSHLDVPQLLKHALGLKRQSKPGWALCYVYFDAAGEATKTHLDEIERFEQAIGADFPFRALTYQELVAALEPARDAAERAYFRYLRDRYFPL